jgi:hypothetical protein
VVQLRSMRSSKRAEQSSSSSSSSSWEGARERGLMSMQKTVGCRWGRLCGLVNCEWEAQVRIAVRNCSYSFSLAQVRPTLRLLWWALLPLLGRQLVRHVIATRTICRESMRGAGGGGGGSHSGRVPFWLRLTPRMISLSKLSSELLCCCCSYCTVRLSSCLLACRTPNLGAERGVRNGRTYGRTLHLLPWAGGNSSYLGAECGVLHGLPIIDRWESHVKVTQKKTQKKPNTHTHPKSSSRRPL